MPTVTTRPIVDDIWLDATLLVAFDLGNTEWTLACTPALAMPPRPTMPFHTELADLLLTGEPMSVTPQGSRRCVAVMAAATASIRLGGRPVVP